MNARDAESVLLGLCERIAHGAHPGPANEREANVVRVSAMLVRSRHPEAADRLRGSADDYFARHPEHLRTAEETVREGWMTGLPRFRSSLERRLGRP